MCRVSCCLPCSAAAADIFAPLGKSCSSAFVDVFLLSAAVTMGGLEFNANTIRGRSNVAMATIGTISAGALYFKLFGGKKVRRLERRDWPIVKYLTLRIWWLIRKYLQAAKVQLNRAKF